jgi:citrate synthase
MAATGRLVTRVDGAGVEVVAAFELPHSGARAAGARHAARLATGAIGALSSELGIPWKLCRGLAVIGRTIGIVGHLAEELRNPLAREIWERIEEEASAHAQTLA